MVIKKIILFLLIISLFSEISEAAVQQMYLVNANAISSTCFAGLASPIGIGNLSAGSEGQTIQTTGGNVVWGSAGAGSVTSITQGTGITATPNPITGSGTIALNTTYTDTKYVNRSSWTTIDNYPSSCGGGQAVTGLGDTLSCAPFLQSYTETESRWQGNYSLVAFVSNLVGMLGNWSADKASYVTTTVFSSVGNWTADKASYATTTALTSVGNWTADRGNYINTTRAWTNDTNMGISGTTLTFLGTLVDGRIASASTWNGKAGTGACTANQFATSTTTGGVTCFQPVGANISSGTITTTQLATGTLNQANLTNTVAACSNQFSRGMGPTTQNCATVGNGDMASGDYAAITGIGTQAENLNMSNYNVTGVQCIVFNGGGTWCTA